MTCKCQLDMFWIFKEIVTFSIISSGICDDFLEPVQESLELNSTVQAFEDIIQEFYVKNQISFDIFTIFDRFEEIDGIKSKVLVLNYAKTLLNWNYLRNKSKLVINVYHSTIIITHSCTDFIWINKAIKLKNIYHKNFKFLIYSHDCGLNHFQNNLEHFMKDKKLSLAEGIIEQFEFLLINDGQFLQLATIEWFTDKACNQPQLKILNSFDKVTKKWKHILQNYEKFQNFYGCRLSLCVEIPFQNGMIWNGEYKWDGQIKSLGLIHHIFMNISKNFNFVEDFATRNNDEYETSICYFLFRYNTAEKYFMHSTTNFLEIKDIILATPGELYTSYEKLRLPFDNETWTYLISTFLIAFVTIFIINRFSKPIQDRFFGKNVQTPTLNIISTFFGISQPTLPNQNIPRFNLIMFVWFCLIFRTCYQSKLFEFMTSESRKPPPMSIEDLKERNYTLYIFSTYEFLVESMEYKERW